MSSIPKVLIPVAPGTNRDADLARAFIAAGAEPECLPLSVLRSGERRLDQYQILAIPGGFSYGDALGAGRLLGLDLAGWFGDQVRDAIERETPVIGICNGFQALVRAGVLPGDVDGAVLIENRSASFECRWVTLDLAGSSSPWFAGVSGPIRCPVAHGEGRFVAADLASIESRGGVALRYANADGSLAREQYPLNPNGSANDVAGITDPSGFVLGLMPHPENHISALQDPQRGRSEGGSCLALFQAGVKSVVS